MTTRYGLELCIVRGYLAHPQWIEDVNICMANFSNEGIDTLFDPITHEDFETELLEAFATISEKGIIRLGINQDNEQWSWEEIRMLPFPYKSYLNFESDVLNLRLRNVKRLLKFRTGKAAWECACAISEIEKRLHEVFLMTAPPEYFHGIAVAAKKLRQVLEEMKTMTDEEFMKKYYYNLPTDPQNQK